MYFVEFLVTDGLCLVQVEHIIAIKKTEKGTTLHLIDNNTIDVLDRYDRVKELIAAVLPKHSVLD